MITLKDIPFDKLTPMMQQYASIKQESKDALLMYRLGDFYEMFFDDAIEASRVLGLALTGRDCGLEDRAPMCGIPYHVSDTYVKKLLDNGYKVAICEQLEDPSQTKGLVKRGIVKIHTPGTIIDESLLHSKSNNFVASIFVGQFISISYCDISTGELFLSKTITKNKGFAHIFNEIYRIEPKEILVNDETLQKDLYKNGFVSTLRVRKDPVKHTVLNQLLENISHLQINEEIDRTGVSALYLLFEYLVENKHTNLYHILKIQTYDIAKYLQLDESTIRNLELTRTILNHSKEGSLFSVIDHTVTAKGGRLLKTSIEQPLIDLNSIEERLDSVELFVDHPIEAENIREFLIKTYDIERILAKVSNMSATPQDMINLKNTLEIVPQIQRTLDMLQYHYESLNCHEELYSHLYNTIRDDAPVSLSDGNIIREGFNIELDKLRNLANNMTDVLLQYESTLKETTNIKNLRIKFNKINGNFIEVSKGQVDKVPENFTRLQTLKNVERYSTPELREIEYKMQNASKASIDIERKIFFEVLDYVQSFTFTLHKLADDMANLDMFISHAETARKNRFTRPKFNTSGYIQLKKSRHPVVEQNHRLGSFIPNDVDITDQDFFAILTGPNMSGKSTYMRQIALNVILAQMGSYIAAVEGSLCIIDKLFTRIGAADSLSSGQSTFMVEMSEVSYILQNATKNSLILLDEVGRGTSTYDGMSIARAVLEYIATNIQAKTLFSTHYQELAVLEESIPGIFNLTLKTEEVENEVLFLRTVERGVTNKSYGIHVAELAGLPSSVINKAKEYLVQHESQSPKIVVCEPKMDKEQLSFLPDSPNLIEEKLETIDIVNITPVEALLLLQELIEMNQK